MKPATCNDKKLNGAESDIDCGGGLCLKCDQGRRCKASSDCKNGLFCTNQICTVRNYTPQATGTNAVLAQLALHVPICHSSVSFPRRMQSAGMTCTCLCSACSPFRAKMRSATGQKRTLTVGAQHVPSVQMASVASWAQTVSVANVPLESVPLPDLPAAS